jgi:hypothetical protein
LFVNRISKNFQKFNFLLDAQAGRKPENLTENEVFGINKPFSGLVR